MKKPLMTRRSYGLRLRPGLEKRLEKAIRIIGRSPWIMHFNTGACNGCDIEVLAALTPLYDPERFGVKLVGSPRHADILLVTGGVTERSGVALRRIYDQMPEPKAVVAVGTCAISGHAFAQGYSILGGADTVVPVDVYVSGCAPSPDQIILGIVKAVEILAEKYRELRGESEE